MTGRMSGSTTDVHSRQRPAPSMIAASSISPGLKHGLTQRDRTDGFVDGLAEARIKLPADRIVIGDFSRDAAYAMTGDLLRRSIRWWRSSQ